MVLTRAKAAREAGTDQYTIEAALESGGENTKPLTRARAALIARAANFNQTKEERPVVEDDEEMPETGQQDDETVYVKTEAGKGSHFTAFEKFLKDQGRADHTQAQPALRKPKAYRVAKTRTNYRTSPNMQRRERASEWQNLQQRVRQAPPDYGDFSHAYPQTIKQKDDLDDVLDEILTPHTRSLDGFAGAADFVLLSPHAVHKAVPAPQKELFPQEIMNAGRMQMILEEEMAGSQRDFDQDFSDPSQENAPGLTKEVTASNAVPLVWNRLQVQESVKDEKEVVRPALIVSKPSLVAAAPSVSTQPSKSLKSHQKDAIMRLQVILGYKFKDKQILIEASTKLRHLYGRENSRQKPTKLQMIGGRSMELAVAQACYNDRGTNPGELINKVKEVRQPQSLGDVVHKSGLAEFGPEYGHSVKEPQLSTGYAKTLTTIIGAVQVDGGSDTVATVMKKLGIL
jgi:hypothetical protein